MEPLPSIPPFALVPLPERIARLLLFVALESEAAPVADALGLGTPSAGPAGARLRSGRVGGLEVVLATPGRDEIADADRIGPVHAASALTRLLRGRFDLVVNMGTAGGFEARGGAIGDLVVADSTVFHDGRVVLPGYDAVARAHTRLSPPAEALTRLAAAVGGSTGLVSSGASLDATADELRWFAANRVAAKDMELAALAVVCREEAVPLVALKGITDLVDHHEPTHEAFERNLARTVAAIADAAGALLGSLTTP